MNLSPILRHLPVLLLLQSFTIMITPVTSKDDIPIHSFQADGYDCRQKLERSFSSCKLQRKPRKLNDPDNPWIGLPPIKTNHLSIYERAIEIIRSERLLPSKPKPLSIPLPPAIPCYMASNYDHDFPPLESTSNPKKTICSRPYVQSTEVLPDGSLKHPSQAEQVLNWQSHNARIQNRVLSSIDQKID
ncbi:hypothetical protein LWI28_023371 [Acer negundo]|uniref:Uncharacterized protein n=1 Tax=Acer negundo TaxID=4023 RepID=A0AAD5IMU8_ACENE|nr:hypothetical protein LWI28_023371 [Acer negundo]